MKAHVLPASYLKGFIDPTSEVEGREPYLWVREPITGAWKARAPRNVANLPDYYATTTPDGSKDQRLENAFAKLESHVARVLRRISKGVVALRGGHSITRGVRQHDVLRLPAVHDVLERKVFLPQIQSGVTKHRACLIRSSFRMRNENAESGITDSAFSFVAGARFELAAFGS